VAERKDALPVKLEVTINSTVYALNARGCNRFTAGVQPGRTDEDTRTSDEEVQAIARRIVQCWNAHDELVAVLTEIVRSIEGGGNIVTFSESDTERYRAALAHAGEQA
jgi:hypothetical protein